MFEKAASLQENVTPRAAVVCAGDQKMIVQLSVVNFFSH